MDSEIALLRMQLQESETKLRKMVATVSGLSGRVAGRLTGPQSATVAGLKRSFRWYKLSALLTMREIGRMHVERMERLRRVAGFMSKMVRGLQRRMQQMDYVAHAVRSRGGVHDRSALALARPFLIWGLR